MVRIVRHARTFVALGILLAAAACSDDTSTSVPSEASEPSEAPETSATTSSTLGRIEWRQEQMSAEEQRCATEVTTDLLAEMPRDSGFTVDDLNHDPAWQARLSRAVMQKCFDART